MLTETTDITGTVRNVSYEINYGGHVDIVVCQREEHLMTSALIHITVPRASLNLRLPPSETSSSSSKHTLIINNTYQRTMVYSKACCRNGAVKYFNNMHSYSQLVLLSWGYTADPPPNYMDFVR